jgi:hypothetical protein
VAHEGCAPPSARRPRHEVADIFREHGEAYRASHVLTAEQHQVMRAIEICRTSVLGGHLDVCSSCGHEAPAYNSCGNRHCPKCQALAQARWLERRREHLLPVPYFHVVFTVPGELKPLAFRNRRLFYGLLFQAASKTLLSLGRDPERLGAQLGFTAVLHSWTRALLFHPHLHCIVPNGGLAETGDQWIHGSSTYLFPVEVIAQLYRGKLVAALTSAYRNQQLDLPNNLATPEAFEILRRDLFSKSWVVYAKRPFAGPEQVYSYLGRYTHRVGISNHRILSVTGDSVTIATRGNATATMHPHEFIRRFLNHVLPKGFVKIRHYGLLASANVSTKLVVARAILQPDQQSSDSAGQTEPQDWVALNEALTGVDLRVCPVCGGDRLVRINIPPNPLESDCPRAPP